MSDAQKCLPDGKTLPRMGGMALRNGLLFVSERHWAAAVRDAAGVIRVASGVKPQMPNVTGREGSGGIPALRGLGRLGETLLVAAKAKADLPAAKMPIDVRRLAAALAASLGATAAIKALAPKSAVTQEVGAALASFVPAVITLKNSPVTGYHGAEHKVIGALEAAAAATAHPRSGGHALRDGVDSIGASKEHDRCGSNLVGPLLAATVVTNLLARSRAGRKTPAASAVGSAASLVFALEAFRWSAAHRDSVVSKALLFPGRMLQRVVTTTEPTAEQLEVGERAMSELLRLEGVKS